MARKPATTVDAAPVELPEIPQEFAEAANLMAVVETSYGEERDLLNQLLGQAQMAGAFEEFSRTVRTSKLAYVKENKLYRALAGKKSPNGSELSGTWEDFCTMLGMSTDKADMDIKNLHAFGEEALESMSRMGIGYRELRQFRRLPEDQKTALIEVAKSGDKDSFLELAEDMIAKHAKEKEALTARAESAEADLEASRQIVAERTDELVKVRGEVKLAKKFVADMTPADVAAERRRELLERAGMAEVEVRAMRQYLIALRDHAEANGMDHHAVMSGALAQVHFALLGLADEFDLVMAPLTDRTPEWLAGQAEG